LAGLPRVASLAGGGRTSAPAGGPRQLKGQVKGGWPTASAVPRRGWRTATGATSSQARVAGPRSGRIDVGTCGDRSDGRRRRQLGRVERGARLDLSGRRTADLRLRAQKGRYSLAGRIAPAQFWTGKKARLTAPAVQVSGNATFGGPPARRPPRASFAGLERRRHRARSTSPGALCATCASAPICSGRRPCSPT
jgi:hypothetical protein